TSAGSVTAPATPVSPIATSEPTPVVAGAEASRAVTSPAGSGTAGQILGRLPRTGTGAAGLAGSAVSLLGLGWALRRLRPRAVAR
ncbi:MAG TPA: hypothetical protein VGP90_09655, partial [Acidimicrobiia bacterium]|nr:hypothetical protein [Acidimicrobiia bacterium]